MIKKAAVLIFIYNKSILFIKRNKNLNIHPGEVSFPGGIFDDKYDDSFMDTALRETEEEIGVKPDNIVILGKMNHFQTLVTHIDVIPFIGKSKKEKLVFNICKEEVEKILIVPIEHLLNDKFKVKVPLRINGKVYYNTFYYYKNNLIWGATSRILDEFLKDKRILNHVLE